MSSSSLARSFITTVQQIICEVTRYPAHLVTPEADLEEDLGIDSVKLVEILAAVRARYQITERLVGNVHDVRTVAAIANQLAQRLGDHLGGEALLRSTPATLVAYSIFTLVAAVLSWHLYELPLNRLKRHFAYPQAPAASGLGPSPAVAKA